MSSDWLRMRPNNSKRVHWLPWMHGAQITTHKNPKKAGDASTAVCQQTPKALVTLVQLMGPLYIVHPLPTAHLNTGQNTFMHPYTQHSSYITVAPSKNKSKNVIASDLHQVCVLHHTHELGFWFDSSLGFRSVGPC